MEALSKNERKIISHAKNKELITYKDKEFYLCKDPDVKKKLRDMGFLNIIIVFDNDFWAVNINEFENTSTIVENMPTLKKINSSWIVSMKIQNGHLFLGHWDGFLSEIDPDTLKIISQKFTK